MTSEMLELGETLESALEDVALHAADDLGDDLECSISVRRAGTSRRVASSDGTGGCGGGLGPAVRGSTR